MARPLGAVPVPMADLSKNLVFVENAERWRMSFACMPSTAFVPRRQR